MKDLRNKKDLDQARKDMKVYRAYKRLKANPRNRATAISYYLMAKYDVKSRSTIWEMIKRVEARLDEGQRQS